MQKFGLFIGLSLVLFSCKPAEESEKCAEAFFSLLMEEEYTKAAKMMQTFPGDTTDYVRIVKSLGEDPSFGKLKDAEKGVGFSSTISNGVATTTFPYELTYEHRGRSTEVTVVADPADGFKISEIK